MSRLQQLQLVPCGALKGGGGELWTRFIETKLSAGDSECLLDLFGENALALHALAPGGIIQLAAAQGADPVQHLLAAIREVRDNPLLE